MNALFRKCLLVAAAGFVSISAQATIIGGDVTAGVGEFVELTLPFVAPAGSDNTVGNNTFQTNNFLIGAIFSGDWQGTSLRVQLWSPRLQEGLS